MIFIVFFIGVCLDVLLDFHLISNNKTIYHKTEALFRGLIMIAFVVIWKLDMIHAVCFVIGAFAGGWLWFDVLLNFLRHKPIDYTGTGSILDRLTGSYPFVFTAFCRLVIASGFIFGYFRPSWITG